MLEQSFFKDNRKEFSEQLENDTLALIFSGREIAQSLDANYPYYPDNNFYYLTGLTEPEGLLAIYKNSDGEIYEKLFIPKADPFMEKWVGPKYSPMQASRISGLTDISFTETAEDFINSLVKEKNIKLAFDRTQVPHQWFYADKEEPDAEIVDISNILHGMRLIKKEDEIKAIEKAADLTSKGLNAVLSEMHPGVREYELASLFEYIIKKNGADGVSFETIAASGPNGPVLHYITNQRKTGRNDLILFDLGARYKGYCADVSRTYPISGKFTVEQEKLYRVVLNTQKELIKHYTSGTKLKDLQELTKKLFKENLEKEGIPLPEGGIDEWYYHSIGHSLGLDTHDGTSRDLVLEDGMVITCEPGLYIKEKGIGIRIEDDILINGNNPIVLTKAIPKEITEICKLIY